MGLVLALHSIEVLVRMELEYLELNLEVSQSLFPEKTNVLVSYIKDKDMEYTIHTSVDILMTKSLIKILKKHNFLTLYNIHYL